MVGHVQRTGVVLPVVLTHLRQQRLAILDPAAIDDPLEPQMRAVAVEHRVVEIEDGERGWLVW